MPKDDEKGRKPAVPTIEYYWSPAHPDPARTVHRVNVRIRGANGEIVAQITQGAKDKRDARRSVEALCNIFNGGHDPKLLEDLVSLRWLKEVGPGPRPRAV